MMRRLRIAGQSIRASLWFVPTAMIPGASVLAVVRVERSDLVARKTLLEHPRIFGAGAQSSRDMLSTIASTMMTVAGVTLSIAVRDDDIRFIPALAVPTAFVLAIVAIGVLVFFIHHVASSLQASGILARMSADTVAAVERLFPEPMGEEAEPSGTAVEALARGQWHPLPARDANDTTTAITCIDSLGAVLVAVADRRIDQRYRVTDGQLRVIARGPTFESLVRTAVDEIRQSAGGNVSVLARLLTMLSVAEARTSAPDRRQVLLAHAGRVLAVSERTVADPENRDEVRAAFAHLGTAARPAGRALVEASRSTAGHGVDPLPDRGVGS